MLCAQMFKLLMPAFYHSKIWHKRLKERPVFCVRTLPTAMTGLSVRTESVCVPDAVDTACSSSLVTTHLAAKALMSGEVAAAASMGVNLTMVQSWTRACLRAGMLSEEGRCALRFFSLLSILCL